MENKPDMLAAMKLRHSVRKYIDKPIPAELRETLDEEIEKCNSESGLHIQLVCDEPKAFESGMAKYGKFSCVKNYLALIGPKSDDLDEKCGYYGERLTLLAMSLGLNSCWVGLTFRKISSALSIGDGEKLVCVIALGYGVTNGAPHKGKAMKDVVEGDSEKMPDWFRAGVEAALLAPTAINQQKFTFSMAPDGTVQLKAGLGFFAHVDLGIVQYHFEAASGRKVTV